MAELKRSTKKTALSKEEQRQLKLIIDAALKRLFKASASANEVRQIFAIMVKEVDRALWAIGLHKIDLEMQVDRIKNLKEKLSAATTLIEKLGADVSAQMYMTILISKREPGKNPQILFKEATRDLLGLCDDTIKRLRHRRRDPRHYARIDIASKYLFLLTAKSDGAENFSRDEIEWVIDRLFSIKTIVQCFGKPSYTSLASAIYKEARSRKNSSELIKQFFREASAAQK